MMPAAYASPYSPHTRPSSLQLTLRASKANVFRSFPASVDFLFFFFLFFIKIYALSHKYLCICPVVVASLRRIHTAPPSIVQLGQFLPINRRAISRTSAMRLPPFLGLRCPGFNFALLFMGLRPTVAGAKCHGSGAVGEVSGGVAYQ